MAELGNCWAETPEGLNTIAITAKHKILEAVQKDDV